MEEALEGNWQGLTRQMQILKNLGQPKEAGPGGTMFDLEIHSNLSINVPTHYVVLTSVIPRQPTAIAVTRKAVQHIGCADIDC